MSQTVKPFILGLVSDLYQWTSTLRILLTHMLTCIKINTAWMKRIWAALQDNAASKYFVILISSALVQFKAGMFFGYLCRTCKAFPVYLRNRYGGMSEPGAPFWHVFHLWPMFMFPIHFINLQLGPHLPQEYCENWSLHCSLEMLHPHSGDFLYDSGLVVYLCSMVQF